MSYYIHIKNKPRSNSFDTVSIAMQSRSPMRGSVYPAPAPSSFQKKKTREGILPSRVFLEPCFSAENLLLFR